MSNSVEQRKRILEGNIPGLVIHMAIPSVVMQLIMLVYNTADTYFISQINKSAAAAVGTVFAIQSVIQAVGFGFGMGVSSICSRKLGEGADDEANIYAVSGIFGAFIVAVVIGIVGLLMLDPLLRIIGCTDSMLSYAKDYAIVILLFAPMTCPMFVVGNILKSEGHMTYTMYGNLAGTAINMILDPILIFYLNWGTRGAALATVMSHFISLGILCIQFARKKTVVVLRIKNISPKMSTYIHIFTTGIPTVFRQGLGALATALMCKQASCYGDAAVAAVTISNKCYMLVRNVVLGIGQGTQPVAGYNYGAGLYKRAKNAFGFAIRVGTVICIVSSALLIIFAKDIMWWFCKDEAVLLYGAPSLIYAGMVVPVMALSTFVNQEYQCLGFKVPASILASCRQGICFIPVILILPVFLGVKGIEMAQPLSDFLTFIISIPFYIWMASHLSKENA